MEDLILILVLSGIGLVTLLVSVWLFYRKKRKTTEKKRACTAECRAAIVDVGNYHARNKHRMLKAAGGVSAAHFLSGAGGTGRRAASLGVKMATLGLYYYPVYRYTYRGETYEQIGNVPAMEEQARKKVGTELTLFIDPAKPTSFYCLEEEKGYFQQRLAYLIVALLVIAVLIMIGVMWLPQPKQVPENVPAPSANIRRKRRFRFMNTASMMKHGNMTIPSTGRNAPAAKG